MNDYEFGVLTSKFYDHVIIKDGCWDWTGGCVLAGYPTLRFGRNYLRIRGHRLSWMMENGEIPDGMNVLHKCDNSICTNPTHLFLGTQLDNIADMISKKRAAYQTQPERLRRTGSGHGNSKLTENDIKEIRRLKKSGKRQWEIAKLYGITRGNVGHILRGIAWRHVA